MTSKNQSLRKGEQRSSLADKVSNNHAWSLAVWKSLRKMKAMQTIRCGALTWSKKIRSSASLFRIRVTHSFQKTKMWEIKCARAADRMTLPLHSMPHVTKNKVSAIRLKSKICKLTIQCKIIFMSTNQLQIHKQASSSNRMRKLGKK